MFEHDLSLAAKVNTLLEEKNVAALYELLKDENPADVAGVFEELPETSLPIIFRLLPKELAADTFSYMDSDLQQVLVRSFSDLELEEVMNQMFVDDAADMIEEMPASVVHRILRHVDADSRRMINQILNYPKDSAGSLMTMEYVDLRSNMTVAQAFDRIRKTGVEKETVYTCYVTDDTRHLQGIVTVKDMLLAPMDSVVGQIMETNVIYLSTMDDKEFAAESLSKYDFLAIPVVDGENRLVGIVTVDDAIDVIKEEATEDIEMMAAITPTDKPYIKKTIFEIYKSRIPWLLLLMVSATFTGAIISSFETTLAAYAGLVIFIPMLMDTGGNSGSQSSVSVIRSISLGEIAFGDFFKVLWKELRVSILCGITLSAAVFVKALVIDRVNVQMAFIICITLAITVVVAKLVGAALPMLAKKIGFDPAVMASPFITTIVDAISLFFYMQVATVVLGI